MFVTDGGMETDLIFNRGVELPEFAAFVLLDDERGLAELRDYWNGFFEIARSHDAGFILDTPTWRANADWGERLGYNRRELGEVNRRWAELAGELRDGWQSDHEVLVDGLIGPRGDGYVPDAQMSSDQAADYHSDQVATFAGSGVDMVTALTINYVDEAIGIADAAAGNGLPAVIAFTVETDGRLPTGQALGDAIAQVDADADTAPSYYMVNCAHPTHFADALDSPVCAERIRGVRANASRMSHAELDASDELDAGDPHELASGYGRLRERLPNLDVIGGCCGTDHRHVRAIADTLH